MALPSRLLPFLFGLLLAGSAAADSPTLTNINTISGSDVFEDATISISYSRLATAANEADDDEGDVISFRLKSGVTGTLTKNGVAVALNDTLSTGETWVWTPPLNQNGNNFAAFSVRAFANNEESSSNEAVRFNLTPKNDAPVLGKVTSGNEFILGTTTTELTDVGTDTADPIYAVFSNLKIDDVDGDNQIVTVTVSKEIDKYGTFSFPAASRSSSVDDSSWIYTVSARSEDNAESALQQARYTVKRNFVPVALNNVSVEVKVTDTGTDLNSLSDSKSGPFKVRSVNDAPVLTASINPSAIPDNASVAPFQLSVSDPDVDETFEVKLAETTSPARGTLTPSTFLVTGGATTVASAVSGVTYFPSLRADNATATFLYTVTDIHPSTARGDAVTASRDLAIQFVNDPTELAGMTVALMRTTDDPSDAKVFPFSTVTVSDADPEQTFNVTLALDDPAKGYFSNGLDVLPLVPGPDGILDPMGPISGTASQITALLRQVVFVPARDRITVNQSETATITLTITDTSSSPLVRVNNQTRVEVTAVNGAPRVLWNIGINDQFPTSDAPAQIDPSPAPLPFAPVEFEDDNTLTVTIAIDDPEKGTLVTTPGSGFQPTSEGSGVYVFTGDEDQATTAIQSLQYAIEPGFIFPPDQPGRTDFTITAQDSALNRTVRVLPVVLISDSRSFMVTQLLDDVTIPGTLRNAIAAASDNDVIVFALPSYPATIRLTQGPLEIEKHLSFRGPGADKLTISGDSNANLLSDSADTRLFEVSTRVRMSGLKLERGYSQSAGGAISVFRRDDMRPGELVLEDCTIANCVAAQWGGAVDIYEGSLRAERCLFENNSVLSTSGYGGGAVSLFTEQPCSIINTTFSGNSQSSPVGYGGGALYAETFDSARPFDVTVTHCTFSGNLDASNRGSSIHSNAANTRVRVLNSIFADFSARNLGVAGAGEILSSGGNISNDNTTTTFIQGGQPQVIKLLNKNSDKVSVDPKLAPLAFVEGRVKAHRLLPSSPAIDAALSSKVAVDQRGAVRVSPPDSGAIGTDSPGRLVIHEIRTSLPQFIELFNPRDQATLNLNGCGLWIDGKLIHTFATTDKILPGAGLVVAGGSLTTLDGSTPVTVPLSLNPRGRIEIRKGFTVTPANPEPPSEATLLAGVSYVSAFAQAFADPAVDPAVTLTTFAGNSITLAPQLGGSAYIPHRLVLPPPLGVNPAGTGPTASPGGYSLTTPFGLPNAFPFAATDRFEVTEDEFFTLGVLANDLDPDGTDKLFVVDLNATMPALPPASNKASILSPAGAAVSVTPAQSPLRGTALGYDPRTAFNHLPAGARVTDTFAYSIIDVGGGSVTGYANGSVAGTTRVTALSHRLSSGETVTISGAGTVAYNGSYAVTVIDADSFSIPVAYVAVPAEQELGTWQASVPRAPTERSQALVEVTVLGRNDPPAPVNDSVTTTEDTVLRIFGDPVAISPALDTDSAYPQPRIFNGTGLLSNDSDPDTSDQPFTKLSVVGVCQANAITGFSGTVGQSPVTVTAAAHGLATGTTVLISGYGGHPSYNGNHVATVTGPDTFTLPIVFVDNAATKGLWTVLNNSNRFATTSVHGAEVKLEIRDGRTQTNVVYNPRGSDFLNGLANGESAVDSFYYAVQDSSEAVSLAKVSVTVTGVNDAPVPSDNPPGLAALGPFAPSGQTPSQVAGASDILYVLPSLGATGTVNAAVRPAGGGPNDVVVIAGIDWTHEDASLTLSSPTLLANDTDVDRTDVLRLEIGTGQNVSREGAAISLGSGGSALIYNPTSAPKLQALAFKERVIDTFVVTVFDGIARVNTTIAVLVEGRNDRPTASNASMTTAEKTILQVKPPGLLASGVEIDQNTRLPDNRKFLLPVTGSATTVSGAKVDIVLTPNTGNINQFTAGGPGTTVVTALAHGLQSGEEIVLPVSGALTGQYVITRLGVDTFSIPVAYNAAFSSLGGTWQELDSTFKYDPTGSVFPGPTGGPAFTLQGLALGQSYVDSFTYTLLDGSHLFANDDIYRVEADRGDIELHVLDNDVSLDGVATSRKIVAMSPPSAGGAVVLNGDQSIIYTPETGFVGDEVFTYTIEDNLGNRDTALVTARVTVDRLNGNLRANADRFTVAAGQVPLLNVLSNDSIIPATGDPLELVTISTAPNQGGIAAIENGQVRYTPSPAAVTFPYTETFAYTMSGGGTARATAVVTVVVVNRANTLNVRADTFSVPMGANGATLNVLENDNILPGNGADLVITGVTTPVHGAITIVDGAALSYSPPSDFLGTDTFTYTVTDGFGGTGSALATVKVGYLTTNTDIFSVRYDDPGKVVDDGFTTLDVLANDNVLQSGAGAVTITAVTPPAPALGAMSIAPDGKSLRFDPTVSATGQQDFTYTITDAGGRSATGTVTVVVVASGIRASSDFFTIQADSQNNELTVLSNDIRISDLPGQLSVTAIGTGVNGPDRGGSVEISSDFKKIVYTPASGFRGTESFTYTVTDGENIDTARVSVRSTIGEMVAGEDEFLVYRGSEENRLAVLGNDRIIPDGGQLLFITAVSNDPANPSNPTNRGTLSIIEDGAALRYTPSPANTVFPYVETFTYEISSGGTSRAQAVIRIEVLDRIGVRNLETNHDGFAVRSDSTGTLLPVLANDSVLPASASAWAIIEVTAPSNGAVQILGSELLYTPQPGFVGTDVFTYKVSDGFGGTGQADVSVKVGDVSVSDDHFTVIAGGGAVDFDVTGNDGILRTSFPATPLPSQADFTLTTARPVTLDPAGAGSAAVVGEIVRYTPSSGFNGRAVLTYWVQDDSGNEYPGIAHIDQRVAGNDRSSATVSITVNGVNDAPELWNAGPGVVTDKTTNHPFLNATVVEYDRQRLEPVTVRVTFPADRGVLSGPGFVLVSPGVLSFTGTAADATAAMRALVFTPFIDRIPVGTTEDTRFTVGMDDGVVTTPVINDATVTTVTPVNDLPILTGTVSGQKLYQRSTLRPFVGVNLTDVDDLGVQPQTVTIQIDNAIKGNLSNLGGFLLLSEGSGTYRMTGSPVAVSTAMRGLVFTPTPGTRITPVAPEIATLTITVNDGFATPLVDNKTTITILHAEVDRLLSLGATGLDVSQGNAGFGTSSEISKDTMVIGSPLRDIPAVDAGRAYVYERSAGFGAPWGQVAEIGGSDTIAGDNFGQSVTIDGDYMVIGAPGADQSGAPNSGAAYVFQRNPANRNAWLQVAKLIPSVVNGAGGDAFGSAVALHGDTLLVGAPNANLAGAPRSGRVFVFKRGATPGSWSSSQTLVALDNRVSGFVNDSEFYGAAVAIDGNTVIIGSHGANYSGNSTQWNYGAAYIYTRPSAAGTFTELKRLDQFDGTDARAHSGFGYSVDVSGDRIAVGIYSPSPPLGGLKPGHVRIYERDSGGANQWGLVRDASPADGITSRHFGCSVALSGNLLLVGAPAGNESGTENRGSVEIFRRSPNTGEWLAIDRITQGAANSTDRYGISVALDGFSGGAGASGDGVNGNNAAGAGCARVVQLQYDLGPRIAVPVPDQLAVEGTPFNFAVNAATFGDPVYPGQLTLSVQLDDGSPLPLAGWLSFNPATGIFSGTPTSAEGRDYTLQLVATNPLGSRVLSNVFRVYQNRSTGGLAAAYAGWVSGKFPSATLSNPALEATTWGQNADPDRDGRSNVLEMLFGLSPTDADQPQLIFTRISATQSSLSYPQSQLFPTDSVAVEWSINGTTWSRTGVTLAPGTPVSGIVRVTATITSPTPQQRIFARIVTDN